MNIAIYKRVSSKRQDTAAQSHDLDAYRQRLEAEGHTVVEYLDKFTGKTMQRPGWEKLWGDVLTGKIDRIVVWRLDRLGRTVSGLSKLFEELIDRKVPLVSLKDSLDLGTAAGRLMAHVLASVAAYETEVRHERQLAGIAAAKEAGKQWGGRKVGTRIKLTVEKEEAAGRMAEDGKPIAEIARVLDVTRQTVYRALRRDKSPLASVRQGRLRQGRWHCPQVCSPCETVFELLKSRARKGRTRMVLS